MSQIELSAEETKENAFKAVQYMLHVQQLKVIEENSEKPWGAYWRIADEDLTRFIEFYFKNDPLQVGKSNTLSPKILLVAPNQRLSWQYHQRRAEIWKVIAGPVMAIHSLDDHQGAPQTYSAGTLITLRQEERHRLIGAENWGLVAEIWQHTDPLIPSDEEDIVRLSDDYGRGGTNRRN